MNVKQILSNAEKMKKFLYNMSYIHKFFYSAIKAINKALALISDKPNKKLSDSATNDEHFKPKKELGLLKYEKESFPVEMVSQKYHKTHADNYEDKFLAESDIQSNYLYQFVKAEIKQKRSKKFIDPQHNIEKMVSAKHFMKIRQMDNLRNKGGGAQFYVSSLKQTTFNNQQGKGMLK